MTFARFRDPAVEACFCAFAAPLRPPLLRLRQLVLDVAAATPDLGPLVETLKWGEPAWLPARPRLGTTLRANALKGSATHYALYVHCQTTLVETFEQLYPGLFRYDGTRALVLSLDEPVPAAELAHCIALALTYHRWVRAGGGPARDTLSGSRPSPAGSGG